MKFNAMEPVQLHNKAVVKGVEQRTATWVKRLQLDHFRNYRSLSIDLDARPVVLVGDNGAGKTNILEAVSLLAPGRGLRRAQLGELTYRAAANGTSAENFSGNEASSWSISTILSHWDDEIRVGTGIETGPSSSMRRIVRIDQQSVALNELANYVSLVWLMPQLDRLFQEGPSARRRFIDRVTLAHNPTHVSRVAAYERALRERQKLLNTPQSDKSWLEALELQMVEHGSAIAAARAETVVGLSAECAAHAIERFPTPTLTMQGKIDDLLGEKSALDAEEIYLAELERMRPQDAHAGRTHFGPHTSDLQVWNVDKQMPARDCSTGEQKALLISIVLASARLGLMRKPDESPLVLLDEIIAHLDETRRHILFDSICRLNCQVWMTGTDWKLFQNLGDRAQIFRVESGTIQNIQR